MAAALRGDCEAMGALKLACICIALALAKPALAEPQRSLLVAVALVFQAPAECGTVETFVAEVKTRSTGFEFTRQGQPVAVTIARGAADSFRGRLEIGGQQRDRVRQLASQHCPDVLAGLALALALALDPMAPEAPPSETQPGGETAATEPTANVLPMESQSQRDPFLLGATGTFLSPSVPVPGFGVGVVFARGGEVGLRFSLDLASGDTTTSTAEVSAAFTQVLGRAALCPRLLLALPWNLDFCAGAAVGAVQARAESPGLASRSVRLRGVASAEGGARMGASFRSFSVFLVGVGMLPLLRDEFVVVDGTGQDRRVLRVDPIGYSFSADLVVPLSR